MRIYRSTLLGCLSLLASAIQAATTLNFDSLPSAQGWVYGSAYNNALTPKETNAYSVDGTKLIQNTMGIGPNAVRYANTNFLHLDQPFTITARLRVPTTEQYQPGDPANVFSFVLTTEPSFSVSALIHPRLPFITAFYPPAL